VGKVVRPIGWATAIVMILNQPLVLWALVLFFGNCAILCVSLRVRQATTTPRTPSPNLLLPWLGLQTMPSETDTVWQLLAYKIYRHAELEDDRLNPVDYARVSSQPATDHTFLAHCFLPHLLFDRPYASYFIDSRSNAQGKPLAIGRIPSLGSCGVPLHH
jgi:hypothetical protein